MDLFAKTVQDAYGDAQEQWTRIDEMVAGLMERRLRQLVAEPLGEEA